MSRSRAIRIKIESKLRDELRRKDMDTREILALNLGKERTVKAILGDWHRDGLLFYHPVSGKHALRLTLATEYMKSYRDYHEIILDEMQKLEVRGKWCSTLKLGDKAEAAYHSLVSMTIAGVSAAMVASILISQDRPDEDSREKHLDMMIDVYVRGLLQTLRQTGILNGDLAEQTFQKVLKDYQELFDRHQISFIKILGKPAQWRVAKRVFDDLNRRRSNWPRTKI